VGVKTGTLTAPPRRRITPVMNVTPLVDVVLVLLIIFMVVTPMMEHAARVDPPGVVHVDPENKGRMDPVTLSLTADGGLFLEQTRLAPAALERELAAIHRATPDRRIVLRGDRAAKYRDARALFALCRRLGYSGIALVVGERQADRAGSR
jgi:biopolymer transport protein TolR